jgi:hypothetical protein
MLEPKAVAAIKDYLFNELGNVFAVIDGAACPELRFKLYDWEPKSVCLWSGELAPDMQEVAPYLVQLDKKSTFTDWLIKEGWNNHWNIFINSALDFKAFRKQIRKLLIVKSPQGKNLVFRFYDPRVFNSFKEVWNEEQQKEIFIGIDKIKWQTNEGALASITAKSEQSLLPIADVAI